MEADPEDNRAASALFRAIGGGGGAVRAEARRVAAGRGMHRGEWLALAVWMPLAAWVAAATALSRWCGPAAGWLLGLPLAVVLLHALPFLLPARTPVWQWRAWLGAGLVWAWFHRSAAGPAGWAAWGWIALGGCNVLAWAWLGVLQTMRWPGVAGIVWRGSLLVVSHGIALAVGIRCGWPWGVLAGGGVAAWWALAIFRPGGQWLGPVVRRTNGDMPLLTIDDGPHPEDTPAILDLLDHHGVKAVFFMIGERVAAHPEVAREVVRRGHEIGNHTLTHPQASFWCAGPWRTWREIAACQRAIREVTGTAPRWFRAPVGHRNPFTHPVCGALGLKVMAWNRRGFDAVERDPDVVLRRLGASFDPGDIILIHEGTPIARQVAAEVLARFR